MPVKRISELEVGDWFALHGLVYQVRGFRRETWLKSRWILLDGGVSLVVGRDQLVEIVDRGETDDRPH